MVGFREREYHHGELRPAGNIEMQPGEESLIFADWLALDLGLAPSSPAIDTGNPDGATGHDIDGVPRDAQPDIGAYELVSP